MDLRSWWQRGLCASLVVALYGSPLGLTGWLGLVGVQTDLVDGASSTAVREAVWYEPPGPAEAEDEQPQLEPDSTEASEPAPAEEPDPTEPTEPDPPEEPDAAQDEAPAGPAIDSQLAMADSPSTVQARRPRRTRRVVKRTPRVLPDKQLRKLKRRRRKHERRARQKQCAELTDHVLLVEEDEAWVTRELVNCYLAHPEQSYRMGGTWWAQDERGKRIGFGVRVSRRHPLSRHFGLKTGDIVLSVNGFKLRTWSGVTFAAPNLLRGRLKLKIIRDGEKRKHFVHVKTKRSLDDERSVRSLAKREDEGDRRQRR